MPVPKSLATDKTVGVLAAPGLEEVEALAVVDCLFRAGVRADLIALGDEPEVVSSHGIRLGCDLVLREADLPSYEILLLPGGMPGTLNLAADETIGVELDRRARSGEGVAAICAAPSVLAERGHLKGLRATANPGFMSALRQGGADALEERVVEDGSVITSRGAGTALDLGLALVARILGTEAASAVRASLVY